MTEIFCVDCSALTDEEIEQFLPFINSEKADRIRRMKSKNKKESMAGELLLRYGINKMFGVPVRDIKTAVGKNGKLFLSSHSGIYFNISHSECICAVIVSDKNVGIDIQYKKDVDFKALAKRTFTENEYKQFIHDGASKEAFYKTWCLKEAVYKLYGDGLSGLSGELKKHTVVYEGELGGCRICAVTE